MKKSGSGRSTASENLKLKLWDLIALTTLYIVIGLVAVSAVKPDWNTFQGPKNQVVDVFMDTMENSPAEWCVFGAPGDGGRRLSFTYLNSGATNQGQCNQIADDDGPGITTTFNPNTRQCVTSNNMMIVTQDGVVSKVEQTTPRAGVTSTLQRYYFDSTPTQANFSLNYHVGGRAACFGCPADIQPYGYIRLNAYAIAPGQEHANFFTEASGGNNKVQYQLYCVEPTPQSAEVDSSNLDKVDSTTGSGAGSAVGTVVREPCGCVAPYCYDISYPSNRPITGLEGRPNLAYDGTHPDVLPKVERDLMADFAALNPSLQGFGSVTENGLQDAGSVLFEVFIEDLKPARNVGTNVDRWAVYVDNLAIDTGAEVHADQVCVDPYTPAP